jgi:hypothetical protein
MAITLGVALNAIAPYFTMFPLDFPLRILQRYAKPSEWVLDPFCGRGTTNFAARWLGHSSLGIDATPVAVALTKAKLVAASPDEILDYAQMLLAKHGDDQIPTGEFWDLAYHPSTLRSLCRLRSALLEPGDGDGRLGIALTGILLGALHGPRRKHGHSYLSNQCPRTYAPKPSYAARFWRTRAMLPPAVDVIPVVKQRAERYYGIRQPRTDGKAVLGDSRDANAFQFVRTAEAKVKWIITSPPYYGLKTYVPDQWLRNWFVGGPARVDYSNERQIQHTGQEVFCRNLRAVWENVAAVADEGARLIVRFGAINDRKVESPAALLKESLRETRWEVVAVRPAGVASKGRRQAASFCAATNAISEIDIWARLSQR